MSLRDKVKRAYLARQGKRVQPQPQQQTQQEPGLDFILSLLGPEKEARRKTRNEIKKIIEVLRSH